MSTTALTKGGQTAATVKKFLNENQKALQPAMPSGSNYDRFVRTAINAISTTPGLGECSPQSLMLACVKAFSVGIEPNGPTQEGYIVPFGGQAQFMPSYRGLIALAIRSGMVRSIQGYEICKNDEMDVQLGTDPHIKHKVDYCKDRGEAIAYYATAVLSNGAVVFEPPMSKAEIEKIRNISKAKNADAWRIHYDEMAKKTVIKRLTKKLPVSTENLAFAKAVAFDNHIDTGESDKDKNIIDIDVVIPDDNAGSSMFERKPSEQTEAPKA